MISPKYDKSPIEARGLHGGSWGICTWASLRHSSRLERAVQAAQEMYARREADNKACYMSMAGIRNEIRAFGGVIPEAGMDVLNLFPPIDPGVLKSSIR